MRCFCMVYFLQKRLFFTEISKKENSESVGQSFSRNGGTMVFNSYSFLLFFPVVLILVNILPAKWRNGLLLLASYLFYASWGKRFGHELRVIMEGSTAKCTQNQAIDFL